MIAQSIGKAADAVAQPVLGAASDQLITGESTKEGAAVGAVAGHGGRVTGTIVEGADQLTGSKGKVLGATVKAGAVVGSSLVSRAIDTVIPEEKIEDQSRN